MEKKDFDLEKFKKEFGLNEVKLEPYDYEKYRLIYRAYWLDLTVEQYEFCRLRRCEWRIENGYKIRIPKYIWEDEIFTRDW